jgi:hypothetical protein
MVIGYECVHCVRLCPLVAMTGDTMRVAVAVPGTGVVCSKLFLRSVQDSFFEM